MTPLAVTPVPSIGTEVIVDVLHGRQYEVPAYPPAPPEAVRLRALRRELGLGLRDAVRAWGVRPVEASGLEHGQYTCDWAEAERRLRAAAGERGLTRGNEES